VLFVSLISCRIEGSRIWKRFVETRFQESVLFVYRYVIQELKRRVLYQDDTMRMDYQNGILYQEKIASL